jgi:hypothetical protein
MARRPAPKKPTRKKTARKTPARKTPARKASSRKTPAKTKAAPRTKPTTPKFKPRIDFSAEQIPLVKEPMAIMRLGAAVMAPESLLGAVVRSVAPKAEYKPLKNNGARAAYDGHRMVAFVDPKTGVSKVFPSLEALKPGQGLAERARLLSARIATDAALFPPDGTQVVALAPVTLRGSKRSRGGDRTPASEYLSFVRFQRRVNGTPVFGPGTRAMIAVAGDDTIRGLAHRWRKAVASDRKVKPRSRVEVAKAILAQLAKVAKSADVKVDKVTLGYYDGGRNFLTPVFRFHATIAFRARRRAASRHVFGYVPVGTAPEPLPVLGVRVGKPPAEPPKRRKDATPALPGDPLVGRYVVRNDTDEWVTSANEFLGGLVEAQTFFGGPIPFTDSQYFWAEPFEFVSDKDDFVNRVHIALNEVHGNWNWFSTRDNNDDGVSLSDIPASGYGGGSGGLLAYWIIHSCEVIPTQTDEASSFDVWWNIFNGLHAVVGYRTDMWIDDDVMGPFGLVMGLGASVVPAWLNEVASNDSYDDGDTYADGNRGIDEPMGRASAVVVCGHSDDTANDVASLGRADCLTEWWFEN